MSKTVCSPQNKPQTLQNFQNKKAPRNKDSFLLLVFANLRRYFAIKVFHFHLTQKTTRDNETNRGKAAAQKFLASSKVSFVDKF